MLRCTSDDVFVDVNTSLQGAVQFHYSNAVETANMEHYAWNYTSSSWESILNVQVSSNEGWHSADLKQDYISGGQSKFKIHFASGCAFTPSVHLDEVRFSNRVINPGLSDGTHVLGLNRWLNGTWEYYRNGTSLVDGVVDYNVSGEMPVLVNTTNLTFTSGSDVPVSLVLNWTRNRSEDWRGVQSTSFKADRVSLPASIEGNSSTLLISGSPVVYQSDGQLLTFAGC